MRLFLRSILILALLSVAGWSTVGQADTSVLDLMPSDALAIAVINRPAELDTKLTKLAGEMSLSLPDELGISKDGLLATVKTMAGVKEGFDEKRAVALLVMPDVKDTTVAHPVILIPVTDYQKLISQLQPEKVSDTVSKVKVGGEGALTAQKGDYAVFVEPDNDALLARVLEGKNPPADVLAWKEWIGKQDVALALTKSGAELFYKHAGQQFAQMSQNLGGPMMALSMAYQGLIAMAQDEVTAAASGLLIEKDGALRISARGNLAANGQFVKYLTGLKPLEGNPLAGLPNEPFILAGAIAWPEAAANAMSEATAASAENFPEGFPARDKMIESQKATARMMKEFRGGAWMLRVGKADQPISQRAIARATVTDTAAFMKDNEEQTKASAEFSQGMGVGTKITVEPFEIDSLKGMKVITDMSGILSMIQGMGQPGGMEMLMIQAMYGKDGKNTMYVVAADKQNVIYDQKDEASVRAAIAALSDPKASLAADPGVAETAGHLPKNIHFVGYFSLPGTVKAVNDFAAANLPAFPKIPEFPATPPIGFSATVEKNSVEKCLYVPAGVVKAMGPWAKKLGKLPLMGMIAK
ncbi:MAG: hypothetical protein JW818_01220 [Pirellulales bacterium]|nr:hypothetical protein [Pirellulales bacterium]